MTAELATYRVHRDLGIEHISAAYVNHRFQPHIHQEYLIGLTLAGVEDFVQDRQQCYSRPGQIRTINPGVVHGGGCAVNGHWSYEALYIPEPLMLEALQSVERVATPPRLTTPVVDDPRLAAELYRLFARLGLERDSLAREVQLATFLERLARHRILRVDAPSPDREPQAVARARDYLAAHAPLGVPLDVLATVAGLSKFYLVRVFKAQTGLTPWQFQTQLRIDQARRLLSAGDPPGQVAAACGFVDQSHLTRRFRAYVGVTPASYAGAVRASRGRSARFRRRVANAPTIGSS